MPDASQKEKKKRDCMQASACRSRAQLGGFGGDWVDRWVIICVSAASRDECAM